MTERGWSDVTHTRLRLDIDGQGVAVAGVDDPHLGLDRYDRIAGRPFGQPDLRLGLTHSPEPRVLDRFAADGYDLVLAGHTHGGQLRVPGVGALVTNCGLDRSRARGASRWGAHMWLHVSAGLGTSPFAPVRFACPPEASLLTLVPRPVGPDDAAVTRASMAGWTSDRVVNGPRAIGVWRSLVARFVRDEEVAGSNPVTPTTQTAWSETRGESPDRAARSC